ncbi:DUF4190 domain-containing protein [Herbiconiux daphne]|uniref:DUF4190 domain-containing protein n=1 Tax=Herbiconiux daphne TaxID=2970914 RepID=A0ABT2H7H7_9MICO|nr:DUF4190 domain-containing protein [Herbiconiux daphne]MCS5735925.1 DUF4190 domain-containing protein [Herbiconiux daphne]
MTTETPLPPTDSSANTTTLPVPDASARPDAGAAASATAGAPAYPGAGAPIHPTGGAPVYAPAGAPAPGYYAQAKTNVLGIVTLVLGVLGFGIVPVITGHIALSQIKRTGEEGRGLTLAGLILGYVTLAGWLIVAAFWIAVAGFAAVGALANGAWVNS